MSVHPTPDPARSAGSAEHGQQSQHDERHSEQEQLRGVRPVLTELALRVARLSVAELHPEGLLRRICVELTETYRLAGCAGVLFDGSTRAVHSLVASHPAAEQLTRLVQQLGEGSVSAAIWSGRNTALEDLTQAARSDLAEAAGRVGLPITGVVALRGASGLIGCLQLYGAGPDTLSEELLDELAPLAEVLGVTLDNAASYQHSTQLVANLSAALDNQRPIEQAKGILTERHKIDLDAAYQMLREQARRRDCSVHAVAEELVAQSWETAAQAASAGPVSEQVGPDQTLPEQRAISSEESAPESHHAG